MFKNLASFCIFLLIAAGLGKELENLELLPAKQLHSANKLRGNEGGPREQGSADLGAGSLYTSPLEAELGHILAH